MLESASIAGGATIAVFLVVILCTVVYINYKRRTKAEQQASSASPDCVDGGVVRNPLRRAPMFGTRWRTAPPTELPVPVHSAIAGGDAKQLTLLVAKD